MIARTSALVVALGMLTGAARADVKDECAHAAEKAQALRASGKLIAARPLLVSCAREECVHPLCETTAFCGWWSSTRAPFPSVVVRARDEAGRDLVAVHVEIDSRVVAEALDGNPIPLDPGTHTVRCEATGRAPSEQRILLAQGDKGRAITVDLPASAASAPPVPAAADKPIRPPIAAYATGGIALASVGRVRTPPRPSPTRARIVWTLGAGRRTAAPMPPSPPRECNSSARRSRWASGSSLRRWPSDSFSFIRGAPVRTDLHARRFSSFDSEPRR